MDVKVGPHWYRNSNGTVEIEGLPQLELELRKTGGRPVRVNFAIFDQVGSSMPRSKPIPSSSMNRGIPLRTLGEWG